MSCLQLLLHQLLACLMLCLLSHSVAPPNCELLLVHRNRMSCAVVMPSAYLQACLFASSASSSLILLVSDTACAAAIPTLPCK